MRFKALRFIQATNFFAWRHYYTSKFNQLFARSVLFLKLNVVFDILFNCTLIVYCRICLNILIIIYVKTFYNFKQFILLEKLVAGRINRVKYDKKYIITSTIKIFF